LKETGRGDPAVIAVACGLLEDATTPPNLRELATEVLYRVGWRDRVCADALCRVMEREWDNRELASKVNRVLWDTAFGDPLCVPRWIGWLTTRTNPFGLRSAATATLKYGTGANEEVCAALRAVAGDATEEDALRWRAADALQHLANIRKDATLTGWLEAFFLRWGEDAGAEEEWRIKAIESLRSAAYEPAVRARLTALADDRGQPADVRAAAVELLRAAHSGQPLPPEYFPFCQRLFTDDSQPPAVRGSAIQAIGSRGGREQVLEVIETARRVLNDGEQGLSLRRQVAFALRGAVPVGSADYQLAMDVILADA
jgi:hypothetical protein